MPMYEFRCEDGHTHDRVAPVEKTSTVCHCGRNATRLSVYSFASPRKWASEFQVPRDARAALDEATGYKHEALAAQTEAVGNGWKGA